MKKDKNLSKDEIQSILKTWKETTNKKLYTPYKYFKGLSSKTKVIQRAQEMYRLKDEKDISKIKYKTDENPGKTKKSKYHTLFEERFKISCGSSLSEKSKVTGIPVSILEKVRQKGIAAYKTGHRLNVTPVQWGNARLSSFLTLGCAAFSSDRYLLEQVKELQKKKPSKKRAFFLAQKPSCPAYKIKKFNKKFPSKEEK